MNDVSKLSGASPVSPTSNRVWKPPRKQKPGDRSAKKEQRDPSKKEEEGRQDTAQTVEPQALATDEIQEKDENGEPLSYGTGGLKKPRSHKVDLII